MARQQKKRRVTPPPQAVPKQLALQWEEAERLQQLGRWGEARELLEELDRRYPNRLEVLASLAIVLMKLGDAITYLDVCEKVARLRPNDPQVRLALISAYAQNERPALALRTMHEFLQKWPDHPEAASMRESAAEGERELIALLEQQGLAGEDALSHAILHEESQVALAAGRLAPAQQLIGKLLRVQPRFAPAHNNASLAHWLAGNLDAAITTAQQVLEFDPNNIHALANLCRYLLLKGDTDAARSLGERLRRTHGLASEVWTKKAEAFSYLGDDEAVLEVFRAAQREKGAQSDLSRAMLLHLAGVAAVRLGRLDEACRYWQEAHQLAPDMDLPRENLEDSRRPAGEQHGGWPFSLAYWLHPNTTRALARRLAPALAREEDTEIDQAVVRFARDHPEIVKLVPHLLDRGDPPGRTLAIQIAKSLKSPELLEALREFALGQRGPDAIRMEAAQTISAAGLLPQGTVRFWSRGEWSDVLLMGFEIDWEQGENLPPRVEELLAEAQERLRKRQGDEAESFLRQALAIKPGAREVEQTLAAAYLFLGRLEEAEALAIELHRREPDYVFTRTLLAQLYLKRDEIERAKAIVEPLLTRKRFHVTEFGAFSATQIQLLLAENQRDSARSWLQMWENVDPENPSLDYWRQKTDETPRLPRLFGRR